MIWLLFGIALWWAAHLFKRVAPEARARLGEPGRGLVALALLAAVVLMVIGYRAAEGPFWWGRSPSLVGINNLLMLFAVYLFAVSGMKTWLSTKIRHPQLTAMKVWALAHILVNGDLPSLILFGGLLAWAVVEVIVINRAEGRAWRKDVTVVPKREVIAVAGTVALTVAIMLVHYWLGAVPWG